MHRWQLAAGRCHGPIVDAFAATMCLDAVDHDLLARILNQDSTLCGTEGIVRYSPDLDHDTHQPGADTPELPPP